MANSNKLLEDKKGQVFSFFSSFFILYEEAKFILINIMNFIVNCFGSKPKSCLICYILSPCKWMSENICYIWLSHLLLFFYYVSAKKFSISMKNYEIQGILGKKLKNLKIKDNFYNFYIHY